MENKTKVLKIIILVPGLPLDTDCIQGGVHSAVLNLLKGFAQVDNIQVRLLSFTKELNQERIIPFNQNVEICHIPEGPLPFSSLNYMFFGSSRLKKQIRDFNADIIHFEIGGTLLTTKLKGLCNRPHLLTIHGIPVEELKLRETKQEKMATYFNLYIGNWLQPGYIIHISDFSRKYINEQNVRKSVTIPNAIANNYFQIPEKSQMSNRLIYIGVINDRKNLLFLLKTLKNLRDMGKSFSLDVCGGYGNPAYQELVENYIRENEIQDLVRLHGWVPQTEITKLLTESDILVLPSKAETLPMAIAESMAAGRFAIASAVGGIPDMIRHEENGFLINLENSEEIVKILASLHNNSAKTSIIAGNARKTAFEKYDAATVAGRTRDFYAEIIKDYMN